MARPRSVDWYDGGCRRSIEHAYSLRQCTSRSSSHEDVLARAPNGSRHHYVFRCISLTTYPYIVSIIMLRSVLFGCSLKPQISTDSPQFITNTLRSPARTAYCCFVRSCSQAPMCPACRVLLVEWLRHSVTELDPQRRIVQRRAGSRRQERDVWGQRTLAGPRTLSDIAAAGRRNKPTDGRRKEG